MEKGHFIEDSQMRDWIEEAEAFADYVEEQAKLLEARKATKLAQEPKDIS